MKAPLLHRIFVHSLDAKSQPTAAIFGSSMFDAINSMSQDRHHSPTLQRHHEKCFVHLQELADENGSPFVTLGPSTKEASTRGMHSSRSWNIPLARAVEEESMLSTKCPTVDLQERKYYSSNKRYKSSVSLSAVAVVVDSQNRVLLTRRAERMRTFPKAWVMPGGGIDSGESILEGVVREVKEETGLDVSQECVEPVAMWESCFPTSGQDCIDAGTGVKAHYLVVFCICKVQTTSTQNESNKVIGLDVVLQEDETDLAVWLSSEQFSRILERPLGGIGDYDVPSAAAIAENDSFVPLEDLCGIYPRGDARCGIAQGHLFMLEELFNMSFSSRM